MSAEEVISLEPARNYLTTADFARLARTSDSTVRYWRHIGTGPAGFRLGRKVLYLEDDVLAWLDQRAAADRTARAG